MQTIEPDQMKMQTWDSKYTVCSHFHLFFSSSRTEKKPLRMVFAFFIK